MPQTDFFPLNWAVLNLFLGWNQLNGSPHHLQGGKKIWQTNLGLSKKAICLWGLEAAQPHGLTAKINFGLMYTIVYEGGLRLKLNFEKKWIKYSLFGDYLLLTPTFFKKNFQFSHFFTKINFGRWPPSFTIVDMKPKLILILRPHRHVAFLDKPNKFHLYLIW